MKVYIVGGYVRDWLRCEEPEDMDFVVVGATPAELLEFGQQNNFTFKQVGADFPVFLDQYGREWALARKERKVGPGYHGFEVDFDPTVTIEEDLYRRDVKVNAMALEVTSFSPYGTPSHSPSDNNVIDPYGGRWQITLNQLEHVSKHFAEDPLRILRVARFRAKFRMEIKPSLLELMKNMVQSGDVNNLVPERIWAEFEKVCKPGVATPSMFLDALVDCGACDVLFPEVKSIWVYETKVAFNIAEGIEQKVAVLTRNMSVDDSRKFCKESLRIPTKIQKFGIKISMVTNHIKNNMSLYENVTPKFVMEVFDQTDAFRDRDFFSKAAYVSNCFNSDDEDIKIINILHNLSNIHQIVAPMGYDDLTFEQQTTLNGPEIGESINYFREIKVKELLEKR